MFPIQLRYFFEITSLSPSLRHSRLMSIHCQMELFNLSHGVKDYANRETFVCVSTSITGLGFLLFFPRKPSFLQSHSDTFRGVSSNFPSRHGKMQMEQSPMLRMSEPRGTGGELTWSNKNGAKTRVGQSDGIIFLDIHICMGIYIYTVCIYIYILYILYIYIYTKQTGQQDLSTALRLKHLISVVFT